MASLKDKINIDIDNIDRIFEEMPNHEILPQLSILELAGVATLLHNFYNGMENIIKRLLIEKGISIPQNSAWHKDLLNLAVRENILSAQIKTSLENSLHFGIFLAMPMRLTFMLSEWKH